jgi:hypothetical protein
MVHNTQNYWVSGLLQSSGIPNTGKHNVSENCISLRPQGEEKEKFTLLGPLEKIDL